LAKDKDQSLIEFQDDMESMIEEEIKYISNEKFKLQNENLKIAK